MFIFTRLNGASKGFMKVLFIYLFFLFIILMQLLKMYGAGKVNFKEA